MSIVKQKLIDIFLHDLSVHLNGITSERMTSNAKKEVLMKAVESIDWDRMISEGSLDEETLEICSKADTGITPSVRSSLSLLKLPRLPIRVPCWVKTVAIASAIIAAWVLSGGTLVVGTVAGGVAITEPILQALVTGASAAALAKIICGEH